MIILTLKQKAFMSHLLLKPTFDKFSLIEGEITTFNKFTIDGFIRKEFYEEAPDKTYSHWKDLREFCFDIIRGKRTPLNFKFILSLSPENFEDFLNSQQLNDYTPQDIQGLYLNIKYDGTTLQCITGISLKTFTMDKAPEEAWDKYVRVFFAETGIEFEVGR